jgi:uncharacterized protein (TIGR02145 family)
MMMNRKIFVIGMVLLAGFMLLQSCESPTQPVQDNVYDPGSELFISSADLVTEPVVNVGAISAMSGGRFENDYGTPVRQKGVCWSAQEQPTLDDACTQDGTGFTGFTSELVELRPSTRYYVRAYARNDDEVTWGNQVTFLTRDGIIQITTAEASSVSVFTTVVGGEIIDDGGSAVTNRGVCYATSENPTTSDSCIASGDGLGAFEITLENLQPDKQYFYRTFATNVVSTQYGAELSFMTVVTIPLISTQKVSSITSNSAVSGGNVISNGEALVTARGVVWSTSQDPTVQANLGITNNGSDIGSFTSNLTGLKTATLYYVRAYATNSTGTSYGEEYSFRTMESWNRDIETEVVNVTNPNTGRVWMDRNLGASRAATSSTDTQAYGDLYQWGRGFDGHQRRNSTQTSNLSIGDQPGHGRFILSNSDANWDWRRSPNNDLWQGFHGVNNPCPVGYRVPTEAEWNSERATWSSNDASGAITSTLKLPTAGNRSRSSGSLIDVGSSSDYWSSSLTGSASRNLRISSSNASIVSNARATGLSVRCLRD